MTVLRRRRERGVVIVLVALGAVVLMLFAAFAVDYGIGANQRRKSQNTADAGALAGGRLVLERDRGASITEDQIVDEIVEVTWENLRADAGFTEGNDLTRAQWTAMFASCVEPDTSGYPTRSSLSECIRFSQFGSRLRVRIPTLHTETPFGRVAGFESIAVDAFAEAEIVPDGSGGLVPFGLPSGSADQAEICLRSSSPGHEADTGACDDGGSPSADAGYFGSLDISFYGNPVLGTPEKCQGQTQDHIAQNIILGADHPFDEYREAGEPGEAERNDRGLCPDLAARPNQVLGQSGIGSALDKGLIAGTDMEGRALPGRLTTTPWTTVEIRRNNVRIDNRPLWEYIDRNLDSTLVPAACTRASIEAQPDVAARTAAMAACIDLYRAAPAGTYAELLTDDSDGDGAPDVLRSPRTAFVPQLHALTWDTSDALPHNYNIRAFRPVFLQALYFRCNNAHGCVEHLPGQTGNPFPLNRNDTLDGLTAFLLPDDMVPQALLDNGPSAARPKTLILRR